MWCGCMGLSPCSSHAVREASLCRHRWRRRRRRPSPTLRARAACFRIRALHATPLTHPTHPTPPTTKTGRWTPRLPRPPSTVGQGAPATPKPPSLPRSSIENVEEPVAQSGTTLATPATPTAAAPPQRSRHLAGFGPVRRRQRGEPQSPEQLRTALPSSSASSFASPTCVRRGGAGPVAGARQGPSAMARGRAPPRA